MRVNQRRRGLKYCRLERPYGKSQMIRVSTLNELYIGQANGWYSIYQPTIGQHEKQSKRVVDRSMSRRVVVEI